MAKRIRTPLAARAHHPVLLAEVLGGLNISPSGHYVDGTFGRGGHSEAILAQLSASGRLSVFDRDAAAIEVAQQLAQADARVQVFHANFSELGAHLPSASVDGILLDLGVSSPQLDQAERGFSFMHDGPLDMRMDQREEPSAATYLANVEAPELIRVLREYGEEPQAKAIANAIVAARGSLLRTSDLANLVQQVKGRGKPGRHPATQVFQAIRMAINGELEALHAALAAAFACLKLGARMAVISFHSLEDRLVKQFFSDRAKAPAASRRDFMGSASFVPTLKLIEKTRASEQECDSNPRARSADLRVVERIA